MKLDTVPKITKYLREVISAQKRELKAIESKKTMKDFWWREKIESESFIKLCKHLLNAIEKEHL